MGWNKVEHYKSVQNIGLAASLRWKHSSNWFPGGSKEDRQELAWILASWEYNSMAGQDVLAWSNSDLSSKYFVSTGYGEFLR